MDIKKKLRVGAIEKNCKVNRCNLPTVQQYFAIPYIVLAKSCRG